MDGSLFVTFLVALTVLMLTPGPDMLFCAAAGLEGGPRAGFLAAAGAASGEVVHVTAAAVGLAALFSTTPILFDALRMLGAGYLLLLGIRALRQPSNGLGGGGGTGPVTGTMAYRQGLITNLLNPKVALFCIAFLPQFVDPHAGSVAFQFLVLGACVVGFEIAIDGSVGLLAGRLTRLWHGPRARRAATVASGTILLGLGAKLALDP
jgi:threonine/homoserine/homoserine lactone efflux protein